MGLTLGNTAHLILFLKLYTIIILLDRLDEQHSANLFSFLILYVHLENVIKVPRKQLLVEIKIKS